MEEEIFKISRNPVRAKALKEMALERFGDLKKEVKTYKIIEQSFEVIKELITVVLYLDGFKTLSHKLLIEYIQKNYPEDFEKEDFLIMDDLRKLRNNTLYYGQKVEDAFLINNKEKINRTINKLINFVDKKL